MALIKPRTLLIICGILSLAAIGCAWYLQHYKDMLPCPLCVIQRYAFLGVALFCLIGGIGNATRLGGVFGLLSALGGLGTAIRHVWVQAHPSVSCGIDPMETMLNRIITADLVPQLFKADGLCSDVHALLGLTIPQWSLVGFSGLTLLLLWSLVQRRD
ncbi:disulfide bond formation protein B [Massilia sp. W12]|uniref:disulfide bond formation protein B n=1 Tax=Massilia sp. W12 TaxID=3126507 RepID=UPI0030D4E158